MGATGSVMINSDYTSSNPGMGRSKKKKGRNKGPKYSLLVAGGRGAGKTTFVQQMKNLYGGPLTVEQKQGYIDEVKDVVTFLILSYLDFISARGERKVTKSQGDLKEICNRQLRPLSPTNHITVLRLYDTYSDEMLEDTEFWNSSELASMTGVPHRDSLLYLAENNRRILADDYSPSKTDLLHYSRTVRGVKEVEVNVRNTRIALYDPGFCSIQPQKKKWVHFFEKMDAVVFVAALGDFDKFAYSKKHLKSLNCLQQTIRDFRFLWRNPYFEMTPFVLLLSKVDIFQKKLESTSFRRFCPGYRGPDTYDACKEFVKEIFLKGIKDNKDCYVHYTNLLESSEVLDLAKDIIVKGLTMSVNLGETCLM